MEQGSIKHNTNNLNNNFMKEVYDTLKESYLDNPTEFIMTIVFGILWMAMMYGGLLLASILQ